MNDTPNTTPPSQSEPAGGASPYATPKADLTPGPHMEAERKAQRLPKARLAVRLVAVGLVLEIVANLFSPDMPALSEMGVARAAFRVAVLAVLAFGAILLFRGSPVGRGVATVVFGLRAMQTLSLALQVPWVAIPNLALYMLYFDTLWGNQSHAVFKSDQRDLPTGTPRSWMHPNIRLALLSLGLLLTLGALAMTVANPTGK
jgi:hypothetical protein